MIVPLTGLSRLRWSRRWCGYLSIFLFLFALGGSLCMILCLAAFPEGGILSRIGFRLYSTHKNWLVALGLSWALSINIYLGRNAE